MSYRLSMTVAVFYVCWWIAGGIVAVHCLPSVMA
jgi:hypothetical protein